MQALSSLYHTKNRIVAVDIVRILAAFIVMYEHADYGGAIAGFFWNHYANIFSLASPLFFILAGFFACRNITWKKALDNSLWCLLPFLLWNSVSLIAYLMGNHGQLPEHTNLISVFGFQALICKEWNFFPELGEPIMPINFPLWFMRDLFFLFLLSPFLAKWAKLIFPLCLLLSLFPITSAYMNEHSGTCLPPFSLSFFSLGCLLQSFGKEWQKKVLSFYSPFFIIGFAGILIIDYLYFKTITKSPQLYVSKSILCVWLYYQLARWIEVKIPAVTPLALKLAPVTFLTFAAHTLFYNTFERFLSFLNPELLKTDIVLIVPPITFTVLCVFFFALKRWCPYLLHLVAHYKLRPDDLSSKHQTN